MRLSRFKVTNFRSVVDSGWIEADQVTALIGVNESGKTNLLLPLWKLNPAREGEIKPTSDYPKANYAAVRSDPGKFKFVTAAFDCNDCADELSQLSGVARQFVQIVEVSRYFDGSYVIEFPELKSPIEVPAEDIRSVLWACHEEISSLTPLAKEASLKPDMLSTLDSALTGHADSAWKTTEIAELITTLTKVLPETPAPMSSIAPRFQQAIDALKHKQKELNALNRTGFAGGSNF